MDSSLIKKSSLTFVHQENVSHILLKHESVHFLARRLMSLYWQEKDMSQRILDRIKRALITILECQSDLTTFCVHDVGQVI